MPGQSNFDAWYGPDGVPEAKTELVVMRVSPGELAWMRKLAKQKRSSMSGLIRQALRYYDSPDSPSVPTGRETSEMFRRMLRGKS